MPEKNSLLLYGLNNDQQGMVYEVNQPMVIGRSTNCDIFIFDVRASRNHTRFFRESDDSLVVEDLGSSNGTFVNDEEIEAPRRLSQGDIVRLGSTEFRVQRKFQKSVVDWSDEDMHADTTIIKKLPSITVPQLSRLNDDEYLGEIGVIGVQTDSSVASLQKKNRYFATLFAISTLVQKFADPDEMLDAVLDLILKMPGGDIVHVLMIDESGALQPRMSKSVRGPVSDKFSLSKTVSNYVITEQCAVMVPNILDDDRFSTSDSAIAKTSRSILAVPIILGTESKGLIALCNEEVNQNQADDDLELLSVAASIIGPALNNLELIREIEATQREVLFMMGAIGETRSKETGNHVKRVAEYSKMLALLSGLDMSQAELLKQASPMHDIGKVGIPDRILNKPGPLNDAEWEIMKTHAYLGYEMMNVSSRPVLKAAAIVAHEHHEKWDGSGYPRALRGEEIHIFGRITAVADVFDALASDRCYKKGWPLEKILDLFREQSGKHFDPNLVDLLLGNLPHFLRIQEQYRDQFLEH